MHLLSLKELAANLYKHNKYTNVFNLCEVTIYFAFFASFETEYIQRQSFEIRRNKAFAQKKKLNQKEQ